MTSLLLSLFTIVGLVGGTLTQGAPLSRSQAALLQTAEITIGGVPLTVELAYQPADTARGLSYRDGLAPGTGMLFLFPASELHTFHMRGMRFCLDFVWINNDTIVGATENICPVPADTPEDELPNYRSPAPVNYVLEVPAGWLAANGLGVGTAITGLPRLVIPGEAAP